MNQIRADLLWTMPDANKMCDKMIKHDKTTSVKHQQQTLQTEMYSQHAMILRLWLSSRDAVGFVQGERVIRVKDICSVSSQNEL